MAYSSEPVRPGAASLAGTSKAITSPGPPRPAFSPPPPPPEHTTPHTCTHTHMKALSTRVQ
eukprot:COSAG05_NODE_1098_length_5892_cov_50.569480_3_plen_61_part_00